MDIGYVVSITITEFLVWYSAGELRLLRRRMLPVQLQEGWPEPDVLVREQVMDLLPHVDLEDEHSILVVSLSRDAIDTNCQQPLLADIAYVSSSAIFTIQPLTQRGGDILLSRLEGTDVKLEAPLFGDEAEKLWTHWSGRRSLKGASSLLDLVVHEPAFTPSFEFLNLALDGIALVNAQKPRPPSGQPLLLHVLCYTRHKAIPESDVGFLMDLGVVLAQYGEEVPACLSVVDDLRTLCKELHDDVRHIQELLTLPPVRRVFDLFAAAHSGEVDLNTAVLFLKWKHSAQRSQTLELDALLDEITECSGRVEKHSTEAAVWLFGLYWGFDRMARECYLRAPERYRFLKTSIPHYPVELVAEVPVPLMADEKEEHPEKKPAPKSQSEEDGAKTIAPESSESNEEVQTPPTEPSSPEAGSITVAKETSLAPATKSKYADMNMTDLKKILKEVGRKGFSKMNKDQLVKAAEESESTENPPLGL